MPRIATAVLSLVFSTIIAAQPQQPTNLGEVAFANSGKAEAQADFLRGLALLHNFEYPRAAASFKEAEKKDPDFAMAYWGEGMTYTHPVWFQQDADAARAALQKLGKTPEERAGKAATQREKDYLNTAEVLYGDGTKEERDFKYSDAMLALHQRYPDDIDATAFAALSLLGTTHQGRDFATYMRAAAMLEEVFPAHQHHPGVLHYLIHCYDDPIHARLGLRAARLYGAVAPNAGHALHMTSHIFIAMGMWDAVLDANRRAIDVVNQQRAAEGLAAKACGHFPTWLHYAYLQERRFDEASKALAACRAEALTDVKSAEDYANMRAQQVGSGGALADAVPGDSVRAGFTNAYADLLAGHADAAARILSLQSGALARITKRGETNPAYATRIEVIAQQARALELIAAGKRAEAIGVLERAAKQEQAMPLEFGPPLVEKPTYELLAEQYVAAGRAADAERAYREQLARTPGRALSVRARK
jgi:tetratricopeptide (TPR) repeat protein